MNHLFRIVLFIFFLLPAGLLKAQNITGSWNGYMSGEYLEVNVEQRGTELCGFSYDYELDDHYSYCIANFRGRYDKDKKIYFLNGSSFVENSGSHVLMRIILWRNNLDAKNILRGKVYIQSNAMSIFGMGGDDVILKKTSGKQKQIEGNTEPCFPKPLMPVKPKPAPLKKQPAKPVAPKTSPAKPAIKKPAPVIPVKKDTTKISLPVTPIVIPREPSSLEHVMTTRKQSQQSRITIDTKEINLKVYDNGTVDNDSVSIFYNGRLLLSHQRLSEKAIELNIQLDENTTQHVITMFAENLGSIPPNTALVVVTAGSKRYELRSKASLEENAVLIFDYKPK